MQHGAATGCNADLPTNKKSHIPLVAAPCTLTDVAAVPPRGVKLSRSPSGNRPVLKQGSAKCSAPGEVDLELVALIQAWPTLSKAVQQQIMLLVG